MAANLREHLVAYFEEHHKLVEADALDLLLDHRQPLVVSRELIERAGAASPFVTREMVETVLAEGPDGAAGLTLRTHDPRVAILAPPATGFHLINEGYSGPVVSDSPLVAYSALFHSRYRALARMVRGRPELENLRPVREIRTSEGPTSIIGMVRDIRETVQRHHLILTLDDETGSLEVLVPKDSPGSRSPFLPDEVVGVRLEFSKEPRRLPRVVAVERPEVPRNRVLGRSRRPVRALFLSDLHLGSRSFLSENWGHLVDFLAGRGPQGALASSVEYVVVAGDTGRRHRDLSSPGAGPRNPGRGRAGTPSSAVGSRSSPSGSR